MRKRVHRVTGLRMGMVGAHRAYVSGSRVETRDDQEKVKINNKENM